MKDNRKGAASPISEALTKQAMILHAAVREAVRTSPDSFLKTLADIEAKELDYWREEIQSSTWVLAEQHGKVVGVAACKPPGSGRDIESPRNSRYIESVWIDPALRGQRLGERLIRYLMAVELQKDQNINQFLLWVFERNSPALKLYEHMKFAATQEKSHGMMSEIKYRLDLSGQTRAAIGQSAAKALLEDKKKYGVTYIVLGQGDSV